MLDIKKIHEEAQKELQEETAKRVKEDLKGLYRKLDQARKVVRNVEQEIADALASIGE